MPRRQFVADLQQAIKGVSISGVSDVQSGDDDGEFTFMCEVDGQNLKVSALIPELSDYPTNHICMIYGPDNASSSVASVLTAISAAGKTVTQVMELVSRKLGLVDGDGDQHMPDSQQFDGFDEQQDNDDSDYEGEDYFPGDEEATSKISYVDNRPSVSLAGFTTSTPEFRQRIRDDLWTAKIGGFKVGHLGGLMDGWGCYVSLSIRISKLGISEEAMRAWNLEPTEYFIVLFNYPSGYKNMDDMRSYDAGHAHRTFGVRIGLSTDYKPSMQEAVQAFSVTSKDKERQQESSQRSESQDQSAHKGFRQSFISRPLNELLEQRFHVLLKYRYAGMPWSGAEEFYNDLVSKPMQKQSAGQEDKYYVPEVVKTAYPSLVTADHILEAKKPEHSLPLVGMQFVLRHFVRCTEFCLICFSKMSDDLQAIKPYVCDNPLCLYQYMSLGFGPSIEHEILSQPKVVDLLVSFCCASAREGRLRDFPSGLSLDVLPPSSHVGNYQTLDSRYPYHPAPQVQDALAGQIPGSANISQKKINARYNEKDNELLFQDRTQACPIRVTDWIAIRKDDKSTMALHCRVVDTSCYPSVKLSEHIRPIGTNTQPNSYYPPGFNPPGAQPIPNNTTGSQVASKPSGVSQASKSEAEFVPASFYIYNQNFDDLSEGEKRQTILSLLDVVPPVKDMKEFLSRKPDLSLSAWVDRIPPAALGVLRWIIASNRACILQVDDGNDSNKIRKVEDRLYGMPGWVQFRFAMGAPDKERRFVQSVRKTSKRLRLPHPTMFAWHGSPMKNWHSIIREGLHFNEVSHGRAYGNGVYHSLDAHTSLGYSSFHGQGHVTWAGSELSIQQTLALNEVVNAPQEFVSKTPHLVVAQLDWIQTRYLFVKAAHASTLPVDKGNVPLEILEQDPSMTPRGIDGALVIPAHAISSRRPKPRNTKEHKRQKAMGTSKYDAIDMDADDDDASSVATLDEDLFIFDDDEMRALQLADPQPIPRFPPKSGNSTLSVSNTKSKSPTSYVSGKLDYSTLPILQEPAWASSTATRCLMKDFKNLIKAQSERPLHELGWHIDEDKIENMYQWIVELHSFDPALPLAKDMEKRGVKSVVLELRFGKDYPMSPPFVRVIRPRFLSFAQGGGGNVTAGGAMCMELLTNTGWSAVSSIESVLLQVRVAITSPEKPARLDTGGRADYGVGEAVEAYMRACAAHGWTVPAGFKEMAYGGAPGSDWNLK